MREDSNPEASYRRSDVPPQSYRIVVVHLWFYPFNSTSFSKKKERNAREQFRVLFVKYLCSFLKLRKHRTPLILWECFQFQCFGDQEPQEYRRTANSQLSNLINVFPLTAQYPFSLMLMVFLGSTFNLFCIIWESGMYFSNFVCTASLT